jgi:hypothetical protein
MICDGIIHTRFSSLRCFPYFRNCSKSLLCRGVHFLEEGMNSATLLDLARTKPLETIVEHEIQKRAYELYEQRGKGTGFALQDWLEAEAEVLAKCYPPAHS